MRAAGELRFTILSQRAIPSHQRALFLVVVSLLLLLAGCTSSEGAPQSSTPSSAPVTLPRTTTSEPTTLIAPESSEKIGVIGIGPDYPISVDYLALVEQYWLVEVGSVERIQGSMILIDVTVDYLGDSQAGKLLDLVIELETPSGNVDPLHTPCSPRPKKALDLFGSVKFEEPQSGLLCFPTEDEATALLITPLIDETIRIEISPVVPG